MPLATWIVYALPSNIGILFVTGLAASMAVNTLMTGMIVFKILKVTAGVKPTSIERTLGSARGNKFQHIMFVIIESGMALFAIQLARFVVVFIVPATTEQQHFLQAAADFVIVTNQMLNVISFVSTSSVLLITFIWLGHRTNDNLRAGFNENVLR